MRLAVPVTEGKVAAHFGHCSHFALFDVDEATKAIVKKEVIPSPGHQPWVLGPRLFLTRIVLKSLLACSVMTLSRLFWII
jgi:hypothetical protein